MGNSESTSANELRSHNVPLKLPMPDKAELDERFNKVLQSMNLPPDKMKVLSKYDASKKWQLVCDKDLVQVKHPPAYFVKTINSYLDHTLNGKKFRKRINHSTRVLRDLEISLRTNHIGWVREFLDGQHKGLDVLVNYLAFAQYALVCSSEDPNKNDLSLSVSAPSTLRRHRANSAGDLTMGGSWKNLTVKRGADQRLTLKSSSNNNQNNARTLDRKLKHSRTIIDREDVHVCITCLRAIMNYQQGFTLVMAHTDCINQIVLSLKNRSFKTKSLVLELLAAVCLVQGGHDIILRAFDNFKIKCSEPRRFDSLMKCFEAETENIEFMVSCMQFINIVVHSVEDMNFRVHLQHEFTLLGLDDFLDRLRGTESDRLKVQIQAYLDNMFDVSTLLEDSESKLMAMERIERLEDQLLKKNEQNTWQEYENSCKIVQLEKQLSANLDELSQLQGSLSQGAIPQQYITAENQLRLKHQLLAAPGSVPAGGVGGGIGSTATLNVADLQAKGDQLSSSKDHPKLPSIKLPPAMFDDDEEGLGLSFKVKTRAATETSSSSNPSANLLSSLGSSSIPPPPPMNIPPPPAIGVPPPPPLGAPRIPNLPPGSGLKQKKVYKPKYRLQNLNLTPMRPNQVAGTIFNDLDDDSVLNRVNMDQFEELFKTKAQDSEAGRQRLQRFNDSRVKRGINIIDVNRARNLSILLRKIGLNTDEICQALYNYDLSRLSLEHVEMLPNFMPNGQELKLFKEYEKTGKSFDDLTPEDKFMWLFGRVERLQQRLTIMIFIGSFPETHVTLLPQIAGVIAASMSIKSSPNLKRVLEVVLAFGNYMNSSKRGAVYGFKLQSLDALADTKSADKKWTLLHYIVNVLDSYYPDAKSFYKELRYVDRACKVSFENILSDVASIKKGMHMTEKQCEVNNDKVLTQFITTNRSIVDKILQDTETAKEAYENVVKYFGETPKTMPPETFFPMVNRFIEAYKRAEREVEERKIAEAKLMEQNRLKDQNRDTKRQRDVEDIRADGERMVTEKRSKQRKDRRAIESKDGAIEDNINYLRRNNNPSADTFTACN